METQVRRLSYSQIDETMIEEAGRIIRKGGLVAFPTETVYGLGGDALNPESSKKIYAAKGRPSGQSADRAYRGQAGSAPDRPGGAGKG